MGILFAVLACTSLLLCTGVSTLRAEEQSLDEISRKLDNPLTSLWSLILEDKFHIQEGDAIEGTTMANTLFFQPSLPLSFGKQKEKVFFAKPVFPLVTYPVLDLNDLNGVDEQETGFGDIQLLSMAGPNSMEGLVWGAGATFKSPTSCDDLLGAGKYQAGPALMLFRFPKPWTFGTLVQHWWSYADDADRPDTNQTDIQYIIRYALSDAWSIGLGPAISIDWRADSDDRWTVPVGLGVTKTVRIGNTPIKLRSEVHYSVIRPETFGIEWTFIFRVAPVIANPFKG
jgi:hypothetical protein